MAGPRPRGWAGLRSPSWRARGPRPATTAALGERGAPARLLLRAPLDPGRAPLGSGSARARPRSARARLGLGPARLCPASLGSGSGSGPLGPAPARSRQDGPRWVPLGSARLGPARPRWRLPRPPLPSALRRGVSRPTPHGPREHAQMESVHHAARDPALRVTRGHVGAAAPPALRRAPPSGEHGLLPS
ncbi:unnamed protein product [Coccothraustes coccothraustes]